MWSIGPRSPAAEYSRDAWSGLSVPARTRESRDCERGSDVDGGVIDIKPHNIAVAGHNGPTTT
jgi:hypothetical protein